ncbi:hypothetical protein Ari01nite_74910 [Paractinoplanes rishiriensis]|uniref:Uncharacterized protein n=1 Tax=Paractinoplanes rishiriensis TaxID=1050105 RepID=A0A919MU70_9ACTN|nr:hypothetical protein Ari01nite_74910 [Actinoplanes rishiriensis]
MTSIRAVGQIRNAVLQARVDTANQALSTDPVATKKFAEAFAGDQEDFTTAMTAYRASMPAARPGVVVPDLTVDPSRPRRIPAAGAGGRPVTASWRRPSAATRPGRPDPPGP